jgi:hypothetical protein
VSKEIGELEKATALVRTHKDNLPALAIGVAQLLHDERERGRAEGREEQRRAALSIVKETRNGGIDAGYDDGYHVGFNIACNEIQRRIAEAGEKEHG